MVGAALAHATGIALPFAGFSLPPAPLLAALLLTLVLLWRRPWFLALYAVFGIAGVISGESAVRADLRDCRLHLPPEWEGEVVGRFLTRPAPARGLPFRVEEGLPGGCRGTVRAVAPAGSEGGELRAGERIRIQARWVGRETRIPGRAEWAGRLVFTGSALRATGGDFSGRLLVLRGRVQERMVRLWGSEAPVVEALVLARREHLDPDLREAFALSGTAHLLAISGFHVGVVAGILLGALRLCRLRPRRAAAGAALGCWLYVMGIGAPHAAVRAALLLSLLAATRIRGWPVVPTGALASAFLILLAVEPRFLTSVGFQLSFAGTGGLVLLRGKVASALDRGWRALSDRPLPGGKNRDPGARLLRGSADGLAAGIAATLPTLPLLAWHFDRISLVGIPATLLLAPPVAAAIPGIGGALLLSLASESLGGFVAGGTGLLLRGVGDTVRWVAQLPGASFWVSRPALVTSGAAALGAGLLLRRVGDGGRIRAPVRRGVAGAWGVLALLILPLFPGPGALEVHMMDVGQGDGLALRTPGGKWILIDAGPRSPGYDAGARKVVPYLKRRGVRTLEALVLTHPHLDHIGGTGAVLENLAVRGILDPSRAEPYGAYLDVMEKAREAGVWWWRAEEGMGFRVDGVEFRVLHPHREVLAEGRVADANDLSVVLLVRYGAASLLFTGDAGATIERRILAGLPPLTLLKAGHHGSRTSTSSELLVATSPHLVLIPAGEGNRFGHPHREVTDRIEWEGIPIYRSDRHGDVRVVIRSDGTVEVHTTR